MILYKMSTHVFKSLDQVAVRLKANWTSQVFQVGIALKRRRIISFVARKIVTAPLCDSMLDRQHEVR